MPWFSVTTAIQILKQQVGFLMVATVFTFYIVVSIIHTWEESVFEGFVPEINAVTTGKTGIPLPCVAFEGRVLWCAIG